MEIGFEKTADSTNKPKILKTKLHVLIVEDDDLSRSLLKKITKDISCKSYSVKNGRAAVAYCKINLDVDLVLMDIRMPLMNGYEATRQIRAFNKKAIIIAQTAYVQEYDKKNALKSGCNDYITKPIVIEELFVLLQKHFN